MQINYAVQSKIGVKRRKNEDYFKVERSISKYSSLRTFSMLFAVADGMGGHPCGEIASMMACKSFDGFLEILEEQSIEDSEKKLANKIYSIDGQIKSYTKKVPTCLHMGTTLSVFIILGEKSIIAHVGDTRIYIHRHGKLQLMTTDHTFVQDMVDRGLLDADMVATARHRNVLTKVIGTDESLENIFTQTIDIVVGDRFLLSSDGLHDFVSFQEIESIMRDGKDPEETSLLLLKRAIDQGAQDDITVLVIFIV